MFSTRPLSFLSTSLLLRRGSRRAHISPDADTASSSSSTPFERDPRLPHALYVSDHPPQPQPQASSFPRLGLGERSLGERRDGTVRPHSLHLSSELSRTPARASSLTSTPSPTLDCSSPRPPVLPALKQPNLTSSPPTPPPTHPSFPTPLPPPNHPNPRPSSIPTAPANRSSLANTPRKTPSLGTSGSGRGRRSWRRR